MSPNKVCLTLIGCTLSITTGWGVTSAQGRGGWELVANLTDARVAHQATRLDNGWVLVSGGSVPQEQTILSSAELFKLETGTWTPTPPMNTARSGHTATRLASGQILVTGDVGADLSDLAGVEVFDPRAGRNGAWSAVSDMLSARRGHTATLLQNGRVLVVGGAQGPELYDPTAETAWTTAGGPTTPLMDSHTATLLFDGRVLAIGGVDLNEVGQIYSPDGDSWTTTPKMFTQRAWGHTATRLLDGRVLVVGGQERFLLGTATAECELFDPATDTWERAKSLSSDFSFHIATLLSTGEVLVTDATSAELYDPIADRWRPLADLPLDLDAWTASLLPDGRVLLTGDIAQTYAISIVQLIYPQLVLGGGFELLLFVTNQGSEPWGGSALLNAGDWPSEANWSLDGADRTGTSGFPFVLEADETRKFTISSSTSEANVGWLEIGTDRPVQDLATTYFYNFYSDSGELIDSTGVVPATGARRYRFAVEKSEGVNTGLAIRRSDQLTLRLFNQQGSLVSTVQDHFDRALFFDEIFTGIPDDFIESIELESEHRTYIVVLRQEVVSSNPLRFQLTSVPPTAVPDPPSAGGGSILAQAAKRDR